MLIVRRSRADKSDRACPDKADVPDVWADQ